MQRYNKSTYYATKIATNLLLFTGALILTAALVCVQLFGKDVSLLASSSDKNRIIIIDAGHGGEDCGAIGINGRYEKDLNLEFSQILGEALSAAGYAVVYTRTEDKLLYSQEENIKGMRKISDLKNRVKIAEQYPEAIFVSIHMNSYVESRYSGFQAYYSVKDDKGKALADSIQTNVRLRLQTENTRKIKGSDKIYVIANSPITSVLLECGFLTNADECEKLCQKEYQKQLCFAIVCGIIEYMDNSI